MVESHVYENATDEALVAYLRAGETQVMEYLLEKYKNLVRKYVHLLFLQGGDSDDLMQEGMIGLFKAIQDFDEESGSFAAFAKLCVKRQLYTAVEAANRKKHAPLNHYEPITEESQKGFFAEGPEAIVVEREYAQMMEEKLRKKLSAFENEVLDYYLDGFGYREIAEQMKEEAKTIDNAIQRIRSKAQELRKEKS